MKKLKKPHIIFIVFGILVLMFLTLFKFSYLNTEKKDSNTVESVQQNKIFDSLIKDLKKEETESIFSEKDIVEDQSEIKIKADVISEKSIVRKRIAFVYPKVVYAEDGKIFINDLKTTEILSYDLKNIGGRLGEFHITKNGVFVNIIRNGVTDIEIWSNYNENIAKKLDFQINGELTVRNDFNKIYFLDVNNKLITHGLSKNGLNLLNKFTFEGNIIPSNSSLYTIIVKPNTSPYINIYDIVTGKLIRKQEIGDLSFTNILISEKNVIYKNGEINIYIL